MKNIYSLSFLATVTCAVGGACLITAAFARAPSTPTIMSNILELKTVEGYTETSLSCGIEAVGNEQIRLNDSLNLKIVQKSDGTFSASLITPVGPMVLMRESPGKKVHVQLVNRNNVVIANECDYVNSTLSNCTVGPMFPVTTMWTTRPVWGQIRDVADSLRTECAALIDRMNNRWLAGEAPVEGKSPLPQDKKSIFARREALVQALVLKE